MGLYRDGDVMSGAVMGGGSVMGGAVIGGAVTRVDRTGGRPVDALID